MPALPEALGRKVVAHTTYHVFLNPNTICQRPKSEEAPRNKQFHPNNHQIKVAHHADFEWAIAFPSLCFTDGNNIEIMEGDFHHQNDGQKA
jgi:hypothetical protein